MKSLLVKRWHESGVEEGDTLLLHSSLKRTVEVCKNQGVFITPDQVLDSFLEAVGKKGTLVLPLFNFGFAHGAPFDIQNTPSSMGALTEAGRIRAESVRTGHPIYSFAVLGSQSKLFENIDNESGYAEDSPFGMVKRLNGKIASLDLDDQGSMTFYHHVEEVNKVDYRFFKNFSGDYIEKDGTKSIRTYKLFVRDLDRGVVTNVNPAGELMWEKGLYKGCRPKEGSGLRTIKAQEMFTFVSDLIMRSKALDTLYSFHVV